MTLGFFVDLPKNPIEDPTVRTIAATIAFLAWVLSLVTSIMYRTEVYAAVGFIPLLLAIGIIWEQRSDEVRLAIGISGLVLMIGAMRIVGIEMIVFVPFTLAMIYYAGLKLREGYHLGTKMP